MTWKIIFIKDEVSYPINLKAQSIKPCWKYASFTIHQTRSSIDFSRLSDYSISRFLSIMMWDKRLRAKLIKVNHYRGHLEKVVEPFAIKSNINGDNNAGLVRPFSSNGFEMSMGWLNGCCCVQFVGSFLSSILFSSLNWRQKQKEPSSFRALELLRCCGLQVGKVTSDDCGRAHLTALLGKFDFSI